MLSPDSLQQAGTTLASWPRTMLLSHDRPDGDALGALAGMQQVIQAAGRSATAFIYSPVPKRYEFLGGALTLWQPKDAVAIDSQFDGILIMDTCSWSQIEPVAPYLRASRLAKMVVDHHATRDPLADIYVIDPTTSATCTLLYQWCTAMSWPVSLGAANALFAGIATDTGWFRFSNTDKRALRSAADLIEAGVRPDLMYARLLESYSPARLKLMAEMLATLELHAGGAIAVMNITLAMLTRSGATGSDTEDLVNEPLTANGVVGAALLTENEDGRIRVNFRSKSPEVVGRDLDVAAIAQSFGGGGHRRAAGARIAGDLESVRRQVVEVMTAALNNSPS